MILEKEFYFVRHGQTNMNISKENLKKDHPFDTPLNETGRHQAKLIEPLITSLPIQTVCSSPMKRAQETKAIITSSLLVPHHEIEHLGECTAKIWKELVALGMYSPIPLEGEAKAFMDRVKMGINQALTLPGPVLIVSHGGVHWALNCLLRTKNHKWALDNCGVVHFRYEGEWVATNLNS